MPLTWTNPTATTYLLLTEPGAAKALEAGLPDFVARHRGEAFRTWRTFRLQPLTDIHLRSKLRFEVEPNGDIAYVYIFLAIGLAVLLIACSNFVNLATARAAERAREVGLRKVVGAHRGQLVRQFLGESVLMSVAAGVLAVVLAGPALPVFNALAGKALTMNALASGPMLAGLVGVVLFVGMAAGRDFSREIVTDETDGYLINETAARAFGWTDPADAVGKRLELVDREQRGVVVGVVVVLVDGVVRPAAVAEVAGPGHEDEVALDLEDGFAHRAVDLGVVAVVQGERRAVGRT